MKYYFRYIKIVEVTDKKNYPFNKLLKSNDDGGYSHLSNSTDYPNSGIIYKYQDKYIETHNVIEIDLIDFREMSKQRGVVYSGCEIYEHYKSGVTMYHSDVSPNPFDYFDHRINNRFDIITKNKYINKHEIYIGLYKYNELTNNYDFILYSLYNKDNLMYYVAKN